jgi:signal transduction histidine kinase
MGNALDWETIFGNLIRNSLHHGFQAQRGGRIEIAVKREAKTLRVDYRDDGKGMTETVLAHVFDPFFSTDLQHGMGLGMHLVYNLITHRMGGSVCCDSQPQSGARFQIEIPL